MVFPGLFKGALSVRARDINDQMKIAAANALAGLVDSSELRDEYVLPNPFDPGVANAIAKAVAEAARESGSARI